MDGAAGVSKGIDHVFVILPEETATQQAVLESVWFW
jgi:hypothetical protein